MHKIDTLSFFDFSSFLQKIFLNFFVTYGSFKHISMFSFSFMKKSLIFFSLKEKIVKDLKEDKHIARLYSSSQGCNARKNISEEYASFVLLCTVFGR